MLRPLAGSVSHESRAATRHPTGHRCGRTAASVPPWWAPPPTGRRRLPARHGTTGSGSAWRGLMGSRPPTRLLGLRPTLGAAAITLALTGAATALQPASPAPACHEPACPDAAVRH